MTGGVGLLMGPGLGRHLKAEGVLYQTSHREGRARKQSERMGSVSLPAGISASRPAGPLKGRQLSPWEICRRLGAFAFGNPPPACLGQAQNAFHSRRLRLLLPAVDPS